MSHDFWVGCAIGFCVGLMIGAVIMYGGRRR